MKSLSHLSLLTVAVTLAVGCNDCRNSYENLDFPPYMHQYFGVFEKANYFIYINQDSTKTDSIYISDYLERMIANNFNCTRDPMRRGFINSQYLSNGDRVQFSYYVGLYGMAEIQLIDWSESGSLSIFSPDNLDTNVLAARKNVEPEYFETLLIWETPPQIEYDVWRFPDSSEGDLYFAKNKGLVQFTVPISQDTFKLTDYYIQ